MCNRLWSFWRVLLLLRIKSSHDDMNWHGSYSRYSMYMLNLMWNLETDLVQNLLTYAGEWNTAAVRNFSQLFITVQTPLLTSAQGYMSVTVIYNWFIWLIKIRGHDSAQHIMSCYMQSCYFSLLIPLTLHRRENLLDAADEIITLLHL